MCKWFPKIQIYITYSELLESRAIFFTSVNKQSCYSFLNSESSYIITQFLSCFELYKAEIFETRFAHWLCANECLRAAEFCILISFWKKGKWERKKNFFRLVWKADWFCSLKPDPFINIFCITNFTIKLPNCFILENNSVLKTKQLKV